MPSKLLRDDVADYLAVYVGQPEVATSVAVGQPFVVEAHQMQNRRVKVMDVHRVSTA